MVDYSRETVAKLQEILKSRQLPSSGKKAELVARLQEADKAAETNGTPTLHQHPLLKPHSLKD
jgi:SAP domain-containing ribonucleoprotein